MIKSVCLLLLARSSLSLLAHDCLYSGLHVTLGRMFSLEAGDSSHMLTISLVANCSRPPNLQVIPCSDDANCSLQPSRSVAYRMPGDTNYSRTAFHFYVSQSTVNETDGYSLDGTDDIVEWPTWCKLEADKRQPIRVGLIADVDVGERSAATFAYFDDQAQADWDVLVHMGDFAYNIQDDDGLKGDAFFERMSVLTQRVPYIVVKGNHEKFDDSRLFDYRFNMPATETGEFGNMFYDFVLGQTYFVVTDWEAAIRGSPDDARRQFEWMESRLKSASRRTDIRWRVCLAHRPIYCNDVNQTRDCTLNFFKLKQADDLLHKYRFDLVVNGHEHLYARFKRFVDLRTATANDSNAYLQLLVGHAGSSADWFSDDQMSDLMLPFVDFVVAEQPTVTTLTLEDDSFVVYTETPAEDEPQPQDFFVVYHVDASMPDRE